MSRATLSKIPSEYDIVIIGAGATGCATARELALRGFTTLLLDRCDIGSGTSSRSSRLLYCGLGYMKPNYPLWRIPLHPIDMISRLYRAWLTMRCRTELVREMPEHLSRRDFYFPYAGYGGKRYPDAIIDFGYRLLSLFGSRDVPLGYKRIKIQEARKRSGLVKGLAKDVKSVGSFYEYQYLWPERICVDTALEAEKLGATIRTYTEVKSLRYVHPYWHVTVIDKTPEHQGEKTIRARIVVNASGPWVDSVVRRASTKHSTRQILGVKGVNVMVKLPDEYCGQGLESFSSRGEPIYIFPWGDMHFIGPTEDRVDTPPEEERVLSDEVQYLLNEANSLFPGLNLKQECVLHAWCGVRPSSTRDGKTLSGTIQLNETPGMPNFISVTGVMIMLHRHAARRTVKLIEKKLGRKRLENYIRHESRVIHKPDLASLDEGVIENISKNEHVVTLADLIRRRLPHGWSRDLGVNSLEEISSIAAKALHWSEERRKQECAAYREEIATNFLTTYETDQANTNL
ncbi:MAG: FAD-dependent oxidoreductase [Halomonas sp.]|nr:FAD-dependent oxidoreductase [Halomonas sp.]